jgi:SNF2 family DNA or RNA helicase
LTPIRLKRLRKPPVDPSRALTSDLAVPCPADQKFLPFQIAGIEYIATHSGTLLADDPGSGKTIQSVGLCNYYDDARRVLIICPGFLKPHWRNEFKKWDVKGLTIGIVEGRKGEFPLTDVAIINYEILKDHRAALRAKKWDVVIVDEVHKLKNRRADRTREVLGGIKRDENKKIVEKVSSIPSRKLVLLTGTPTLNGKPKELWNIIQALDPMGLGADWYGFAKRYCKLLEIKRFDPAQGKEVHMGWIWDEADNLEELQEYMRSKFMVRRLKADILPQLPPKSRMVVPIIGRNATVKKAIARQMVEFDQLLGGRDEDDLLTVEFQDHSGAMKKLGLEMVAPAIEVIESDLEERDKIVVMCWHVEVAQAIHKHFEPIGCVLIDGTVPPMRRQELVDGFQTDPDVHVAVGTIGAMGVGFTLTAASLMIFVERDWVPGIVTQAEDRIHRIGQALKVLYKHLVLEGSLAERQVATLIRKQNKSDLMLDTRVSK